MYYPSVLQERAADGLTAARHDGNVRGAQPILEHLLQAEAGFGAGRKRQVLSMLSYITASPAEQLQLIDSHFALPCITVALGEAWMEELQIDYVGKTVWAASPSQSAAKAVTTTFGEFKTSCSSKWYFILVHHNISFACCRTYVKALHLYQLD